MNNQRKVVILEKLASMSKEAKIPRGSEGPQLAQGRWPEG